MTFLSRIRGYFAAGSKATQSSLPDASRGSTLRDQSEERDPASFPRLAEVMRLARQDPARCLRLCREQITETPDYDVPYVIASNFEASGGDWHAAMQTLAQGLDRCRRVSALLTKQGQRYLDSGDVTRMTLAFGQAILAQEPPRSSHDEYLYFGYICLFGDYSNAGRKAIHIARTIWGEGAIDLTDETQADIKRIVESDQQRLDPILRSLIKTMLAEGRID